MAITMRRYSAVSEASDMNTRTIAIAVMATLFLVIGARAQEQPSTTIDEGPPSFTATHGSPLAPASMRTWPKVSVRLQNRKMSALA